MKRVKNILYAFSFSKSIGKITTDELTEKLQITGESFSDELFLYVSPLGEFMPMNCKYKYQQKIPLVNLEILVVF
jgi:hypothetical protein